eukprot:805986-Pelagomonas_calceolata.AAC.2
MHNPQSPVFSGTPGRGVPIEVSPAQVLHAHQPPTTQHQHHPPPAAGAAAPGQNTREPVKKGQEASTDQDSRARARKIAQAIKATWGPHRR